MSWQRERTNLGNVDDLENKNGITSVVELKRMRYRLTLALMLATRTTEPPPWGIMLRAASRAVKNAPCTLISYNRFIRSKG